MRKLKKITLIDVMLCGNCLAEFTDTNKQETHIFSITGKENYFDVRCEGKFITFIRKQYNIYYKDNVTLYMQIDVWNKSSNAFYNLYHIVTKKNKQETWEEIKLCQVK